MNRLEICVPPGHKIVQPKTNKFHDSPLRKPTLQMTVILGIICDNAIVVAADSKYTDTSTGISTYGDKISVVHFSADEILLAQAGLPAVTERIVEIVKEKAVGVRIENDNTVIRIVEESIRQLKNNSDKDQWEYGWNNGGASLMIGFYVKKKPRLYTINIYGHGVAEELKTSHYIATGIGSALADYILSEFLDANTPDSAAVTTAIYAIEKVKDHQDTYCGGDTKVKLLYPIFQSNWPNHYIGKSSIVNQDVVNETEKRVHKLYEKIKKAHNKKAVSILSAVSQKMWEKHLLKVKAEEARTASALEGLEQAIKSRLESEKKEQSNEKI